LPAQATEEENVRLPGDLSGGGVTLPGWKQDVVSFELGITFH
jgi:hypothetical protein